MEHDIFAAPTNPDTLPRDLVFARFEKNERDFKQSKTIAIIAAFLLVLGILLSFFGFGSMILLLAGLGGVAYGAIYGGMIKWRIKLMRDFGVDDSAVLAFEAQRSNSRSKAFGNTTNRQKAFCILTEDWLYSAYVGTLFPLREIASTHSFLAENIHYVRLTLSNGKNYNMNFGTDGEDVLPLQQTLVQLLPNTKHTRERMASLFPFRHTIEEINIEENLHGL